MKTITLLTSNPEFLGAFLFWIMLASTSTDGKLLKVPQDTTVAEGERIRLECTTDLHLSVFWYHNGTEIFYGGEVSLRFKWLYNVTKDNHGEFNLQVESATQSHNGVYTCGDNEGQGEKRSASVIVTTGPEPATVLHTTSSQMNTASWTTVEYEQANHLGAASVVGIVLAVLAGIFIAGTLVVLIRRRKSRQL